MVVDPPADDALTLLPLTNADRPAVEAMLGQPRLSRRTLFSGLHQLHPIDWSTRRRTFVVRAGDTLAGTVELRNEDDDPETWELTVVLDLPGRPLDAARCAIAGLFFAFSVLDAEAVWFWAPRENRGAGRFADRVGFTRLHSLLVPGGKPADVFELDRHAWETRTTPVLSRYLNEPVTISDGAHSWRGDSDGFIVLT